MRVSMKRTVAALISVVSLVGFAGCGSGSKADTNTIKVMYWSTTSAPDSDLLFKRVKEQMEKENSGVKIELQAVAGSDSDYKTKVALAFRSAATAPDVVYEGLPMADDVEAGYLLDISSYVKEWEDWEKFIDATKKSVTFDNKTYAVPLSTDTRGIWYNKEILQAVGVEIPWQPKGWQDILDVSAKIKEKFPDVTPFNMYDTGEGGVTASLAPLLFGTKLGDNAMYDSSEKKWVIGSQGFKDSLEFLKTLYDKGYAVSVADSLDTNVQKKIQSDLIPNGKLTAQVEGNWYASAWADGGSYAWSDYDKVMGLTAFPTQNGQEPGYSGLSGGWAVGVGSKTKNPKLAFEFVSRTCDKDNSMYYTNRTQDINPRTDVADDPDNQPENPYAKASSDLVQYTHYRPGVSEYPKVSSEMSNAMEAVVTGDKTVDQAAADYDKAVTAIVGEDKVIKKD